MENWKFILACLSLGLIVWLLYPSRSLTHQNEENVVEIFFMGPLGPIADGMAEAVAVFEQRSLEAHRKDASKPIYRVISGQTAAKDQVADPTRFLISVAGGMPPDVIYFDRFAIAEWAARGAFDPLDPFIVADVAAGRTDTPNKNDFYQAAWAESVYGGKQYGIPCSMDNRALFCNVDLLLRAGLVDEKGNPKPPGTWEEFLEYCKKLCEYDEDGRLVRAGFVPDWRQSWLAQHAWANGAEFLSADGKTVLLNSPEVLGAVKFLREAADVQGGFEKLSGFKASFQGDAQDPFYTGKLAMVLEGVWALDGMATFARDVRFIAAPMPRPKKFVDAGAPPMSFCGGWAYAIPTNARNKQAAWEFIRFMAGEEATRIQIEADRVKAEAEGRPFMPKQQPLIKLTEWSYDEYVARNADLPAQYKSGAKVFNDLLPYSRFRPITPVGQLLWNEQRNALQASLYGLRKPEQALAEGNDVVQRALNRVLAPPTGRPIQSWGWFFTLYGVLLAIGAAVAYFLHVRKHPSGTLTRRQWPGGLISASPWLIGFVIFGGGPMLYSLVMSFCDYDVLNPPRFIGGENYHRILTDDPIMPEAIWNTAHSIWTGPPDELIKFAAMDVTPLRVAEVAKLAHRELALGSVVVFDSDLHSAQFTEAAVNNWKNLNPAVATARIEKDLGIDVTKISYDFAKGDQFVLTQEFDLPFPAEKLQRLRFRHRADDTWHAMTLSIEAAGVKYIAERANNLQDLRWITATYQKPSADDESTKMKKWLVIYPKETGAQFNHGPNRIRIVLDFKQRSHTEASFAKARYNYQRVLEHIPFWRYVRVSILLVILNIVLTLFSSSIVAYAFSRLQWPGRDLAFVIMLGTMMIPAQVTMIPNFLIWKSVGAYNTLTPLWAGAVFGNAFFIFLMRQFLKGVPADLEDAARIDGCGFLRIYWHVMLPLVKPSLAAIAIFTFMGTWNDFLGPLMFVADQRLYPLAFGLYAFAVQVDSNAVMTMAASVLMTLPVIVVFFLTQRYFVQGITLTGMKG